MSGDQLDLLAGEGEATPPRQRPVLDVVRAPKLAEYLGLPVTWGPWQPPVWSSLAFHVDMSCEVCGVNAGAQPFCSGTVPERRRQVPPRERGYAHAATPEVYPVQALMAFRCTACASVHIVAHGDDAFYWEELGPGALPVGARVVPRPPRAKPPRRAPDAPPAPVEPAAQVVASADARRAARDAYARSVRDRKSRPPIR